jgi:NAD-dependent dihydropyrimidine dehydrogenase PreA subunit
MRKVRNIVNIDEEKCNGCGICVPACAEGAIAIIDGKARVVSEIYCDGLGACLGECPQDAITVEQRLAEDFDPKAVERHLQQRAAPTPHLDPLPCGCPGSTARSLGSEAACDALAGESEAAASQLRNWPVQIRLVPPTAPYLEGADLIITADCVPFAFAGFHRRFLAGRVALVGCPKLDDAEFYLDKLAEVFAANDIASVEVAYMEVPCCAGLVRLVQGAIEKAGKQIPLTLTNIGINGQVLETAQPVVAHAVEG